MTRLTLTALLVLAAGTAQAAWGPGACASGPEATTHVHVTTADGWRPHPDDADYLCLWQSGRQLGVYRQSTRTWYPLNPDGVTYGPAQEQGPGPDAPVGDENYGVDRTQIGQGRYRRSGVEISREDALDRVNSMPDDANKPYLTVLGGTPEQRQAVLDRLRSIPESAQFRVHAYAHDDPLADGFRARADQVTVTVQRPDGGEVSRTTGDVNEAGLRTIIAHSLGRLRTPRPDFDPGRSPDLSRPQPDPGPSLDGQTVKEFAVLGTLALIVVLLLRRKQS